MDPAGRAHRIEAVRAGHEDEQKTAWSGSSLPYRISIVPEEYREACEQRTADGQSRDVSVRAEGAGGLRAQHSSTASRGERARCCACVHTIDR